MFSYIIIMNCSSFANFCVLPVFCFLLIFFGGGGLFLFLYFVFGELYAAHIFSFCVVFIALFFYILHCATNVPCVSRFSILGFPFGFL
jgi:hypothetical protein